MFPERWELERFLTAQNYSSNFENASKELLNGQKVGHWMWFIFPQMLGLGKSEMSRVYGITSIEEARQYILHPILGSRLEHVTNIVLGTSSRTIRDIFGEIDACKFHSSMTLFDMVKPQSIFEEAILVHCGGKRDRKTISLLSKFPSMNNLK